MSNKINFEIAAAFRSEFKQARLEALEDAEKYSKIITVIERLGFTIFREKKDGEYRSSYGSLEKYKKYIYQEVSYHLIEEDLYNYEKIYTQVKNMRNDAMHQGAYARNLTHTCTYFSILTEDILLKIMENYKRPNSLEAKDLMVTNLLVARYWQPIDFVRQQMLANSFSYIPVCSDSGTWHLVAEIDIINAIGHDEKQKSKNKQKPVKEIIGTSTLTWLG